jgi:hypothetical protein
MSILRLQLRSAALLLCAAALAFFVTTMGAAGAESPTGGKEQVTKGTSAGDEFPLAGLTDDQLRQKGKVVAEKPSETVVLILTGGVLLFGLLVLSLMTVLMLKNQSPDQILRLFTVPLVVVAAVFLIVTGYTDAQIAPVIGLFGTLVGYILGAQSNRSEVVVEPSPIRSAEPPKDEPEKSQVVTIVPRKVLRRTENVS